MYLVARVVGLSMYIIVLLTTLYSLRHIEEQKISRVLFVLGIALCTMAYFYFPAPEADLFRIQQYAENFSHYSWSEFVKALTNQSIGLSTTPAAAIMYRVLGMIGIEGLIAAFSCAVCFGIILYIVNDIRKRYNLSSACVAVTIFCLMSADFYMPTIATIRSYMASALVFFCIYRETKRGKTGILEITLYGVVCLLHAVGIALVIIRISAVVFQRTVSIGTKLLYITAMLTAAILLFDGYRTILFHSVESFETYVFGDNISSQYSYKWEQVILIIMLVIQIHTLICAKRNMLDQQQGLSSFYAIGKLSVIVLVLMSFQFSIFMRLSYFAFLVEIPLLMNNNRDVETKQGKWTLNIVTAGSILMLLLTCSRGYLCSLKFWQ